MAYIIKIEDKEFKGDITKAGNSFKVLLDGKEFQVEFAQFDKDKLTLIIDNKPYQIFLDSDYTLNINGELYNFEVIDEQVAKVLKSGAEVAHKKEAIVTAPMPGLVIEVEVKEGESVKKGQGLLIIEAMKMQNEFKSPRDGIVKKIMVQKGQTVNSKDTLIIIE
uniref:Biotin/lipoyl-binding protein n=1 Tax=candidate division WOR-3 bacterium TaxID=2052148 RepID=A0A7V0Z687_UNCW3